MVFESLVVDLLNRFLGPYVENLDASQLKLGIWSGDAVLQELFVKEGALDQLNLPVKIKFGHLGKLTLKIPWKNLYSAPVEATLEGLHILVVPNSDIKYDAESDAKSKWEAKQKTLQGIEDAKKKEAEKDKPADPKAAGFAEKVATQVIKNIQVKVNDIHVRYEDRTTNKDAPFAIGATLEGFSVLTTDENWLPCILDQSVEMIYKLVQLNSLAVYWNTDTTLYSSMDRPQLMAGMVDSIAKAAKIPEGYQYLIEPISSQAQMRINPRAEAKMEIPKAWLNLVVNSIGVALQRKQYRDVMKLLQNFEMMARNMPYRKYKPDCPLKGNAKKWWHYAMNSVLKEEIKRRSEMWSWEHMKKHRQMCKEYTKLYLEKIDTSKPGKNLIAKVEALEKELDVLNITLCRQQAEAEFRRLGKKRQEEGGGGWFGGWFGGGKKKKEEKKEEEKDIAERFQEAMTEEEKAKMYAAIGYSESAADPTFPPDYVGVIASVTLEETSLRLIEDASTKGDLVKVAITDLSAKFNQRPSAQAIKLEATLADFSVHGTPVDGKAPQMVESQTQLADTKLPQIDFNLETNPMDGLADQRIRLKTQPLKVTYDANTVIEITKFFLPPDDVKLDDLSAAATSGLMDMGGQSTTGLQYMVDNKKITDIGIEIKPLYVVVPEKGIDDGKGRMLIVDLGEIGMKTQNDSRSVGDRKENESFEELVKKAYDRFDISLKSMQVILTGDGDDWQAARKLDHSPYHILQPLSINLLLQKCMVEDPRLAKIKMTGDLPDICVDISDFKLEELMKLILSIPFPEGKPKPAEDAAKEQQFPSRPASSRPAAATLPVSSSSDSPVPSKDRKVSDVYVMAKELLSEEDVLESDQEYYSAEDDDGGSSVDPGKKKKKPVVADEGITHTRSDVQLNFELKKIGVNLFQRKEGKDEPLMTVGIHSLGVGLDVRPMDMAVDVSLGSIGVEHKQFKALDGSELFLVKTPAYDENEGRLLTFSLQKADKKHPEFTTTFKSTLQSMKVNFTGLQVVAHSEAILHLTEFADNLVASLKVEKEGEEKKEDAETVDEGYSSEDEKKPVTPKRKRKPTEVIDIQLVAELNEISLSVCSCTTAITDVSIKGLEAGVTIQKDKTSVSACLQTITVTDPTPDAVHPRILSTIDPEVFKMKLTLYNQATEGSSYSDMDVVDIRVGLTLGCIRVVFLNKFVAAILGFVEPFSRAKAKAAEAGASAAQSAKTAAADLQSKASRVALDVTIKAPLIVVPRNSKANKGLVANLGELTVKNHFTIAAGTEGNKVPAVLDNMNVKLSSIQLSRAIIENEETKSDVLLLEPLHLSAGLVRNMAPWFHGVPSIAVNGKLETIRVAISTDDFGIIMALLNENLAEGDLKGSGKETAVAEKVEEKKEEETAEQAKPAEEKAKDEEKEKEETSEVWVQVQAAFEIGQVGVDLYTGKVHLENKTGRQERPQEKILGSFQVVTIAGSATINSDNSIIAKARLANVLLNDHRPERGNGITKMIYCRESVEGEPCDMVAFKFEQNAKQDKNIEANLQNLHACICTEFLMSAANIFTKGMAESAKTAPEKPITRSQPPRAVPSTSQAPASKPTAPPPEEQKQQGSISIKAAIERPEIILVADSSTKDTNALVLQFDADVTLNQSDDSLAIQGGINALRINACPYLEEKRKGSINKVLVPCNIGFNLSNPEKKGMKISATIPEIILNISPPTVMVLSAAAQNLTPPPDEDEEEAVALPPDLWSVKDLSQCNFWFLREDEEGTDVAELFAEEAPVTKEPQLEELVASIDSILVKIEAEGGKRFVPMLILQANMHAVVKDWSSKLTVQSSLKMEVSSYNERVAAWEPLLEPIEFEPGNHHPWELQLSVVKNDDIVDTSSLDKSDSEEDSEAIHLAPPAMTVTVSAPENLELTVTKTSLQLFQKLGAAFGEAVKNPAEGLKDNADIPACTVINKTGLKLDFKPGAYYEMPSNSQGGRIHLGPSDTASLEVLPSVKSSMKGTGQAGQSALSKDMNLAIQLEGYEEIADINLIQAGSVLYNLKPVKKSGDVVYSVIIDIEAQLDARKVIVRSPLKIINHFSCPLQVFTKASNWVEKVGDLPADSDFVVPLEVAHTADLLVGPADDGYHMCDQAVQWRALRDQTKEGKKSCTFKCPKKEEGHTPFFFSTLCETKTMRYVKGSSLEAPKYDIHLYPVVTLKNLLSVPVYYTLQGTEEEVEIKSTERAEMRHVEIGKTMMFMRIPDYNGMEWRGEMTLRTTLKEYSQWGFKGEGGKWMEVGVWVNYKQGFQDMAIFTPYWLINKTGLPLSYKGINEEIIEHPAEKQEPIMFSYPTSKSITPGKNKIQVKCGESQWSDKFSLDAVGSTGFISCKTKEKEFEERKRLDAKGEGVAIPKKYNLGVQIQLSYLNYTKMVLFTPRYLVVNETDYDICVSEPQGQSYEVAVHGCKAFWPIDKKNTSEMVVKKKDEEEVSLPFSYGQPHTTVLKLGKGNGVIVEVQITEAATVVAFRKFSGGNFTLQVINDTDDMPVTFHQQGVKEELKLEPLKAQLYTWQEPLGSRKLVWKVDDKEHVNNLIKDGIGEIKFNSIPVYWVSFLDGTQRLLLFTNDLAKATKAQQAAELEQVDQEVIVALPGIGLSLVNNITRKEISYIGITSSGIIWQNKIRRRWKDLNIKEMKALEDGYQKHVTEVANNKDAPPKAQKLEHHLEVDFTSMIMMKPNKRSIQRTYQDGLWLQLRKSAHQFQFHIKVNRLQVDNQTPAAIFPTVLSPVPLPKTVAAESAPKPMIEFSVMMRTSDHSTVKQFKYLKVLVQEMAVKLDMGFLSSIAALVASDKGEEVDETGEKRQELMKNDFEMVTSPLREAEYVQVALAKDFNFYDSFHLSPLKIHVSFSLSDTGVGESDVSILNTGGNARANTLNLIMQSVGVTLTNVDDVLFKLGFFEREYQFYTPEQLSSEVIKHYSNQALKQLYVLVLGLDVIGNPFGFVRGVGEGVKDFFYEPYQGIVQGPEEFAEGVALGMRSLFGHAVGGAAGAVSRITGTLGKGLAALTMDEEYKRKRQQAINQKPATFQEGVARGGKGLVMGFYEGVSGVVKDPLKGAKKEGAKGFFKGVGKGLAGVVAKPTGGIIDFASGTFEGIRRVVDVSEEVKKIRAPRYLGPDGVTRPYVRHDAEGLALLQMTEKGKFAATEDYVAHMIVTSDKKSYLLVTTSRIIYAHRGDVMGSWVVEFEFHFKNLKEDPSLSDKGILITPKEKEGGEKKAKRGLGLGLLKHKHSSGKLVQYLDKNDAQQIIAKISQARSTYLKDVAL